jgi:arginase
MSAISLIGVPFHLGERGVGMGRGPLELLAAGGIPDALRGDGHDVEVLWLDDPTETNEVARVFELNRALAGVVRAAREAGRLPLIASGNCNVCLGAIGGIGARRTGIVWLDAHPDYHTPETTDSGFLDGMGLASATGACWTTLSRSIPGFGPVLEEDTVLIGTRDIDDGEEDRLDAGAVTVIRGGGGPGSLPLDDVVSAINGVAGHAEGVYLHLDFDAIDPSLGRANEYAAGGGLGVEDIRDVAAAVAQRTPVLAASFTAYDPGIDPDGRFRTTAIEAVSATVAAAAPGAAEASR